MSATYPEPVAKLLAYGEPEAVDHDKWPNYPEQTGIELAHVPDLLRMLDDKELRTADPDETDPKYWGPIHAWRTLGQLKAVEAVKPLLDLAPEIWDDPTDLGEWVIEEFPQIYGLIGKDALPLLERYLADPIYKEETRINISGGLKWIAQMHPEAREDAINILTHQLEAYEDNPPDINGFLILYLSELKAREALPLIKRVFAAENADGSIVQLDDVLVEFGLKEPPPVPNLGSWFSSPALKEGSTPLFSSPALKEGAASPPFAPLATPSAKYFASPTTSPKSTKKAKQKMAKASKKKNHRK